MFWCYKDNKYEWIIAITRCYKDRQYFKRNADKAILFCLVVIRTKSF